jgi:hypothetical protein
MFNENFQCKRTQAIHFAVPHFYELREKFFVQENLHGKVFPFH